MQFDCYKEREERGKKEKCENNVRIRRGKREGKEYGEWEGKIRIITFQIRRKIK